MEISVQLKISIFALIKTNGSRVVATFTRISTISKIFHADDESEQKYSYNQVML